MNYSPNKKGIPDMPRFRTILTAIVCLTMMTGIFGTAAKSQSPDTPLDVFGYFQVNFDHCRSVSLRSMHDWNSFVLQQLNLMLTKQFTPSLSSFINFEATNTYASDALWGSFSISEAWVRYELSDRFNIKAGLLIPTFNNLNEIKNRTPLLPYIIRPLIYESSISGIFNFSTFFPQQAFVQVYGSIDAGDATIDLAAYFGNSEPAFVNSNPSNYQVRGIDTTTFKLVGARIGTRIGTVKFGVSGTIDKTNMETIQLGGGVQQYVGLGAMQRYRVGGDLSFAVAGFSCEIEIVHVLHSLTAEQKAGLQFIQFMQPQVGASMDKMFYYGVLNYDFNERMYAYGGYNYLRDRFFATMNYGLVSYTLGGGYRFSDSFVLKGQYGRYQLNDETYDRMRENHYMLAFSVFF